MLRTCAILLVLSGTAVADPPAPAPPAADTAASDDATAEPQNDYSPPPSYSAPPQAHSALQFHGYLDVGAAKAQGNGTSFSPKSEVIPADYGVDPFAPAVNSLGNVASTNSGGLLANGFLPGSMNIGGHASAFINLLDFDLAYAPESTWYMAFARVQILPRLSSDSLNADLLNLEQAFVKLTPIPSQEFQITIGRFDSVFGIEYLENESPIRTNIVPSLVARYTTGQQLGAKVFYRMEFPSTWSALSLNVACTTNPPVVPALLPSAVSLSGAPEYTGRLGYELNRPRFQIKIGTSASWGPRGDQTNPNVHQLTLGGDFRLTAGWFYFGGEYVHVQWDNGGADKVGDARLVSPFLENGGYAFFGLGIPLPWENLRKVTPYFRYDLRTGGFTQFAYLVTDRYVAGLRIDVMAESAIKIEYLWNEELEGAPNVPNNVLTSSFVFVF